MVCVNVFYVVRNELSVGSDKNNIVKIAHFGNVMSIDMTLPKWAIFTIGVYGEIICLLSAPAEISFLPDHINNVDTHYVSFSSKKKVKKKYRQKSL